MSLQPTKGPRRQAGPSRTFALATTGTVVMLASLIASTSIRPVSAFASTICSRSPAQHQLMSLPSVRLNGVLCRKQSTSLKRQRPWETVKTSSQPSKLLGPTNLCRPLALFSSQSDSTGYSSDTTSSSAPTTFRSHSIDDLIGTWRTDPSLTDVYQIPTLSVPAESVHNILKGSIIAPYLASNMDQLKGIHPRVKLVRDAPTNDQQNNLEDSSEKKTKLILLDASQAIPPEIQQELESLNIIPGPSFELLIPQEQQTPHRILEKLLPPGAQPPPTSYEQVGHVLHLNLKPHHEPYGRLIGDVLLDKLSPSVETIVTKIGEVKGPYRTYDMEVLAGKPSTEVTVVEHRIRLHFDLAQVYWSTRLSGQRTRSLDEDILPGQIIADAFCGVGALCVRAAIEKNCTIVANDLNPDAIEYCRANAERNGVNDKITAACGDAHDFIASLGHADDRPVPHHLMLNFPLASVEFLRNLRYWPIDKSAEIVPTVHVYTFARGDTEAAKTPADVAMDMVAIGLLPELGSSGDRVEILNDLGCNIRAREVRDVAPGKVVMWVTFQVTDDLLQKMLE
mmetsp:Transcript_12181/g.34879  ORF Transcript_12181/g.34879 Transcript_12181/m.34879 type:complete len:565 (-) Transcript_12181:383-2077(-)